MSCTKWSHGAILHFKGSYVLKCLNVMTSVEKISHSTILSVNAKKKEN